MIFSSYLLWPKIDVGFSMKYSRTVPPFRGNVCRLNPMRSMSLGEAMMAVGATVFDAGDADGFGRLSLARRAHERLLELRTGHPMCSLVEEPTEISLDY